MTTIEMSAPTSIETTALGRLDREGRLLNAVFKGPTTKSGRFGFRGDVALKFQTQLADEKRPPEFSMEQVLTVAQQGESTIPILVGYIHSFAYLNVLAEVLDGCSPLTAPILSFATTSTCWRNTVSPSRHHLLRPALR